jgi:hypothetical protein
MGGFAGAATAMLGTIDVAAKASPARMNSRRSSLKLLFSPPRLIGALRIEVSPFFRIVSELPASLNLKISYSNPRNAR